MYATTSPTALRATTFISSFFPAQSFFPHVNSVILRDILISYNTYPTGRIRMLPRIQLQDLIRMYHTQLHPVFLTNHCDIPGKAECLPHLLIQNIFNDCRNGKTAVLTQNGVSVYDGAKLLACRKAQGAEEALLTDSGEIIAVGGGSAWVTEK